MNEWWKRMDRLCPNTLIPAYSIFHVIFVHHSLFWRTSRDMVEFLRSSFHDIMVQSMSPSFAALPYLPRLLLPRFWGFYGFIIWFLTTYFVEWLVFDSPQRSRWQHSFSHGRCGQFYLSFLFSSPSMLEIAVCVVSSFWMIIFCIAFLIASLL